MLLSYLPGDEMFQKSIEMNRIIHVGLDVDSDCSQMIRAGEWYLSVFSPRLSLRHMAFFSMFSQNPYSSVLPLNIWKHVLFVLYI